MAGVSRILQQLGRQEKIGLGWIVGFCFMIFLIWACILLAIESPDEDIIDFIMNATVLYNVSDKRIYISENATGVPSL